MFHLFIYKREWFRILILVSFMKIGNLSIMRLTSSKNILFNVEKAFLEKLYRRLSFLKYQVKNEWSVKPFRWAVLIRFQQFDSILRYWLALAFWSPSLMHSINRISGCSAFERLDFWNLGESGNGGLSLWVQLFTAFACLAYQGNRKMSFHHF